MREMPEDRKKADVRRARVWTLLVVAIIVLPPLGYYGYQRGLRTNFGVVAEGKVYRSAQPDDDQIRDWTERYGLKTIINLRGRQTEAFDAANRTAAAEVGVRIIDIRMGAQHLPTPETLIRLIEALETAEQPVLLHCRDGADRTGLASVLAAMAIGRQDYEAARKQFSLKYFYIKRGLGRIDRVLTRYEEHCRRHNLHTGGWREFRHWALTVYTDK